MKRRLLIVFLVLGGVAVLLFTNTKQQVPLHVGPVSATSRPTVGLAITFQITNMTARPFRFSTIVLAESNGAWNSPISDYVLGGDYDYADARAVTQATVQTHETPAVVRLRIHYWEHKTKLEEWLDKLRQKVGLRATPSDLFGQVMVTDPVVLPAR